MHSDHHGNSLEETLLLLLSFITSDIFMGHQPELVFRPKKKNILLIKESTAEGMRYDCRSISNRKQHKSELYRSKIIHYFIFRIIIKFKI